MDFGYFLRRFDHGCHIDPDKEAVVYLDQRITYRQMKDRAVRLANALHARGVKKGDRVAVLLRNCAEWFDIFFALASLGAVLVPVNFLLKSKEIEFIVKDSGATILLVGEDLLELIDPEKKETPELREIICLGKKRLPSGLSYSTLLGESEPIPSFEEEVGMDDLFILQYTSGTTGFPKGAMHTHGTLLWNSFHQVGDFKVHSRERYLCVPGLCWVAGLHDFTLPALWIGGTVVLVPSGGLDIGRLLRLIEVERITKVLLVPTILKQVVDFPDIGQVKLDSLDAVLTGAEPVPVTVIEKFNKLFPKTTLMQGYGLSEGPTIALYLSEEDAVRKIGSAGKPSTNCELLIVDENLKRVAPGEKGEIVIKSPCTMIGYWNRPEAAREVFAGGWLHTGDLAEYDQEGYIYIKGRKKDMYISGGLNVYPAEIENIILKDERVAEAAVIGIQDEKWGEVGLAIIVPKEGMKISPEEVDRLCQKELAGYKKPARYIFRTEPLPRTASGKIKKFELNP
ncbi:MAG: AMP-binding protein [Deltaproteobacteria bacterium]|nr:AMP-binding protein [Deltaproteobacteria bacterium]